MTVQTLPFKRCKDNMLVIFMLSIDRQLEHPNFLCSFDSRKNIWKKKSNLKNKRNKKTLEKDSFFSCFLVLTFFSLTSALLYSHGTTDWISPGSNLLGEEKCEYFDWSLEASPRVRSKFLSSSRCLDFVSKPLWRFWSSLQFFLHLCCKHVEKVESVVQILHRRAYLFPLHLHLPRRKWWFLSFRCFFLLFPLFLFEPLTILPIILYESNLLSFSGFWYYLFFGTLWLHPYQCIIRILRRILS